MTLTQIGLFLDALGVFFVTIEWLRQKTVITTLPMEGQSLTESEKEKNLKSRRYKRVQKIIGIIGACLLISGFSLQLFDTF